MIVVLDACVLYPASLRDLLLTLAAFDAFDPRWSGQILGEVIRNVSDDYPDIDPVQFESHTIAAMRRAFPDASLEIRADVVGEMDNDPKDRHVAAVAVHSSAAAIVTNNTADFASQRLREARVDVITPGALVERLLTNSPEIVVAAVEHLAARWINPPRTVDEIIDLLARHPSMDSPMQELRKHLHEPD